MSSDTEAGDSRPSACRLSNTDSCLNGSLFKGLALPLAGLGNTEPSSSRPLLDQLECKWALNRLFDCRTAIPSRQNNEMALFTVSKLMRNTSLICDTVDDSSALTNILYIVFSKKSPLVRFMIKFFNVGMHSLSSPLIGTSKYINPFL